MAILVGKAHEIFNKTAVSVVPNSFLRARRIKSAVTARRGRLQGIFEVEKSLQTSKFPGKFPETEKSQDSLISERISGNSDLPQRAARRWRTAPPQLHVCVSAPSIADGQANRQGGPGVMPSEGSDRWWRREAAVVRAPPPGKSTAIEEAFLAPWRWVCCQRGTRARPPKGQ